MKKLITVLALSAIMSVSAFAQTDTAVASFLNSLKSFLVEEGYGPKIDEDGDLQFKMEGRVFWYSVQQNSDGSFFVQFCRASMGASDADMNAVYHAVNQVNAEYRCAKAYVNRASVQYSVEFFAESPAYAKRFFSKHISILHDLASDCQEYYSQYADE